MGQREKLLEELRNNPKNARFEDLHRLLTLYGYDTRSRGSTHFFYKRKGCHPVSVVYARPVGEIYVKRVLAAIESCAEVEEE